MLVHIVMKVGEAVYFKIRNVKMHAEGLMVHVYLMFVLADDIVLHFRVILEHLLVGCFC